tara:strand:- start:105 stop:551 length:447 start_codon:yes stop_codon:yes gene_type:complete
MSANYLNQSVKSSSAIINNIVIDKYQRPAKLFNQQTSPTTTVDVLGNHTVIIQTQPLITPHDNATQFKISNLGINGRSSWTTGDIVKVNIVGYGGFDGLPFITGYKDSGTGDYIIDIANVVKTGFPPDAYALNGLLQISVELFKFNMY